MVMIHPNGEGRYEATLILSNFATSIYGREGIEKHLHIVVEQKLVILRQTKKSKIIQCA